MTEAEPPAPDDDEDVAAAEFALGVLDGPGMADAEQRFIDDRLFREEVEAWRERLHPLIESVPAREPPPTLWPRIVAALPRTAAPPPKPSRAAAIWRSLGLWRGLTAAGIGAAVAAIWVLVTLPTPPTRVRPPPLQPVAVALLAPDKGPTSFVVAVDPARRRVTVVSLGEPAAADKTPQLWLLTPSSPPQSLGLLDGSKAIALPSGGGGLPGNGAQLAVSIEPKGGSPSGTPTGPVVATGVLSIL